MTHPYFELLKLVRETEALAAVAGRTGWDQETMMPAGAAEQRAEEMAALEAVLHARHGDPRVADLLQACGPMAGEAAAQLARIRRDHRRATAVPADLATALARATSLAQGVWARARAEEDWDAFAPSLAEIVSLKRAEAAALARDGDAYDALLDGYEPDMRAAEVAALFDALRGPLLALRDRVMGRGQGHPALSGTFDSAKQLDLARDLARRFGYDLSRGRIDLAAHPFSSGSGTDVRITTRTDPADPFNCLYSTLHEVGHATYEQRVDSAYLLTPIGRGASMGVHESQSRLYENQIGRSRPFTGWLFGVMTARFGDIGVADADLFHAAVNAVQPGFIRTEADEVHYNLHIMMRFDLERDLIAGRLQVADLPEAWNARFAADFGRVVDKPSQGVLQDIHWAVGLFGYFPTYTLGNIYAGCLWDALRRDLPDLDDSLAQGDPGSAMDWLRRNLQRHGALHAPAETIAQATGAAPTAAPLIAYLEDKFAGP